LFREFRPAFARKLAQLREPIAGADNLRFPARRILDLIGDKWTPVVLYCISLREVRRFNELQRQIPDISKKMLIQTLRNLERDGLVERTVYQQVPPKTEYRLTEDGRRLREPISQLCAWAMENEAFVTRLFARRDNLKGHTTYKGEAPARRTFIRCVIDFCTMPKGRFVWSEAEIRTDTQPTFYIFFNLGDGRDQASAA
jgi:DNA-binding HxlR family transcriptional regulator